MFSVAKTDWYKEEHQRIVKLLDRSNTNDEKCFDKCNEKCLTNGLRVKKTNANFTNTPMKKQIQKQKLLNTKKTILRKDANIEGLSGFGERVPRPKEITTSVKPQSPQNMQMNTTKCILNRASHVFLLKTNK